MANPLNLPSPKDVIQMLTKERDIRLSPEYIKKCDEVADEPNGWLRITDEMQKQIVKDAGFKNAGFDIALNMMRRAQYDYPDDPIVKDLVYVKNNKANIGTFKSGDDIKDIELYDKEGNKKIQFNQLLSDDKVNIIFAASHT